MKVVVIGSGVIGLCSAIRLAEAGYSVQVFAKELPPETTSNVAAAIWYPYKASPEEKVREWGAFTLKKLIELAKDPSTGVQLVKGKKVFHRPMGNPWWAPFISDFRRLTPEELGESRAGYAFSLPVADTSIYVTSYLMGRLKRANASIEIREFHSIQEALSISPLVVNCSGLGSKTLFGDERLYPIRGQIVRASKVLNEFHMDSDHPLGMIYVIPRTEDVILGGVAIDEDWSLIPDPSVANAIVERCQLAVPQLKKATILSHLVGLRPGREEIRLEVERFPEGVVIHNYGHGGSGVTLSWGCAEEVLRSLKNTISASLFEATQLK